MKCAHLALFVAIVPFGVFAQAPKPISDPKGPNTLQALGLVGPVHIVTETQIAHVDESEPNGSAIRIKTSTFSPDGRLTEIRDCDTQNSCNYTWLRWDSNWPIEVREKTGLMDKITQFVRDGEGRLSVKNEAEDYFNGYVSRRETRYVYDHNTVESVASFDDIPCERWITIHEPDGGIETTSHYYRKKQENGQFDWALEERHQSRSEISKEGIVRIVSGNAHDRSIRAYDASGMQIEETVDSPNYYNRTSFVYNDRRWLVERSEWDRAGGQINCRKYTYETDSLGNSTRQTEHFGSSAMEGSVVGEEIIRNIEYF
jgi:hypothetical protein